MKNTYFTLTAMLAWGADALVARDGVCCFHLTASGGAFGSAGQLPDGQNRIGGSFPQAIYCINPQGGIADGIGRGCIFTSEWPSISLLWQGARC